MMERGDENMHENSLNTSLLGLISQVHKQTCVQAVFMHMFR